MEVTVKTFEEEEGIRGLGDDPFVSRRILSILSDLC